MFRIFEGRIAFFLIVFFKNSLVISETIYSVSISFGDEHQVSSAGQVSKVQKHVDGGQHCHANLL